MSTSLKWVYINSIFSIRVLRRLKISAWDSTQHAVSMPGAFTTAMLSGNVHKQAVQ